jgi:outer membrane lipoprotein carrier protein
MRKLLTGVLGWCFYLALGCALAWAAPKTPQEWSKAVQKRYAEIKTMRAVFEQRITHAESSSTEERRGEIYFQKPLLVRWTTEPPREELLVITDALIWQYFPDEELAYKYPLESVDDKNAFLRVLFGVSSLEESFEITVLPEENKLTKLKLEPYEPSVSLLEAAVWVEAESATIRRLAITDFYGNISEMNMTGLDFNLPVPEGTFAFTPPEGTEIEDHTGGM